MKTQYPIAWVPTTPQYILASFRELKPSTPLPPLLEKWPQVFLEEISRLAPGGLPFSRDNGILKALVIGCYILAGLLFLLGWLAGSPWPNIAAVFFFGMGWIGAGCGQWWPGPLKLEGVAEFRGLTEAIIQQQRRLDPGT